MTTNIDFLLESAETTYNRVRENDPDIRLADAFAAAAHAAVGQTRKYTGIPYIHHPRMVASALFLTGWPESKLRHMVQAALLHDVVEDTEVEIADLLEFFDPYVVGLVEEVTEPDGPDYWRSHGFDERPKRKVRRSIEVRRRAHISDDAQTVSVADIIANSHDIVAAADRDFALLYQNELRDRLDVLTRADPTLWLMASKLVDSNLERLNHELA